MGAGMLGLIGTAGYFVAALVATLFVVLYPVLARVFRNENSLHIFLFMLVLTILLDHGALTILFHDYPGRVWVRAIGFPMLAIVMTWRVLILLRVQILQRKKD